ncbi:hypothetical protein [Aquimarina sp. 2201CG5-10]|uniref:hypothetical protein n=1 Tax=Aquimarina callyspongiae TaxID=3098150 RepID=UPI002AB5BD92|nr:hypothetical protein [Aquimarina sp. 2201CG5-10]MDY8136819.1 hypothetical protein [Aquimarina sp. 2201CG5-10]
MIKKEIIIGLIAGILANTIGFIICVFVFSALSSQVSSFQGTIDASLENGSFGSIIALGAIFNLGLFFLFLKQNKPYRARGVLLATLIAAACIAISKFS